MIKFLYSILFITFFKKLFKFLLSTYTEFIQSFQKIYSKIYVKSKIQKIMFYVVLLPHQRILQLPPPLHQPIHQMVIRVCVNGERCAAPISFIKHNTPPLPQPVYFCYVLLFWPGILCCDFKDVSCQEITFTFLIGPAGLLVFLIMYAHVQNKPKTYDDSMPKSGWNTISLSNMVQSTMAVA